MPNLKYLVVSLLLTGNSAYSQQVHLSGNIPGLGDMTATINYYKDTVQVTDSIIIKNGKFAWSADITEPQKVDLAFPQDFESFFIESGNMEITATADLKNFTVKGSKVQDEAVAYELSQKDLTDQEHSLYEKYGNVGKEEQIALEARLNDLNMQKRARLAAYITAHPNSPVATSLVADRAVIIVDYDDVNELYVKLAPSAQQSGQGLRIAQRLAVLKKSRLGETMLDFTQHDTAGMPVRFADFKGNYVLVDFWASWCGPCRAENPNVLTAYHEYKDKNFTVIGISLDIKVEKWAKAIKEDKMPWTQLSDLKGWQNSLAGYYGIMAIPFNLLVDPSGKIIAKDLRGEALHAKLAQLLH